MPNWYQTNYKDRYDKGADGTEFWYIGGEAISFIDYTLQVDAVTDLPTLVQLGEVINSLSIKLNGDTIFDFPTGADFIPNMILANRKWPYINLLTNTDPSNTHLHLQIPFGRFPFDPDYGLNKVERDDLWIEIAIDDADTNVDNPRHHLSVFYTPNKTYRGHRQIRSKTLTQAAAGLQKFTLDRSGKLLGLGFFSTTVPLAGADTATVDYVRLLLNNKYEHYQFIRWATFYEYLGVLLEGNIGNLGHYHADPSSGDTAAMEADGTPLASYAYLPLEWFLKTGEGIDLKGLSSAEAEIYIGDTNAARMFPDMLVSY